MEQNTDKAGNESARECLLIPVYDLNGGFVTGAGWFVSPPGAYTLDPGASGKAHFGFNSKYEHGANLPTGDTQFRFTAANFVFQSASYEWLVVAGHKAQYKGSGTISGSGSCSFKLTAVDGDLIGSNGIDRFRLKVWGPAGAIYDNQMGASDTEDPATAIGVPPNSAGSIIVHK